MDRNGFVNQPTSPLEDTKQTINFKDYIIGQKSINIVRKAERDCYRFSQYILNQQGDNRLLEETDHNILDTCANLMAQTIN